MVLLQSILLVGLSASLVAGYMLRTRTSPRRPRRLRKPPSSLGYARLQDIGDIQRDGYGATGMAAAIVIRGHSPLGRAALGLANRATKAPVTADTPFPIFSITKSFVGALAVKLAQEGRLEISAPRSGALADSPNADRISTANWCATKPAGSGTPSAAWNVKPKAARVRSGRPRRPCSYARHRPHGAPGKKQDGQQREASSSPDSSSSMRPAEGWPGCCAS